VSEGSVRNAIVLADDGARAEEACPATTSDVPPGPEPEVEKDCSAAVSDDLSGQVPVLADPVDRGAERVLARFGLIASAPPVFTGAHAPRWRDCCWRCGARGHRADRGCPRRLRRVTQRVLSLDTMLCESVFRALLGEARAQGAAPDRPARVGSGAGVGPVSGGQDDPPQDQASGRGGQGRRLDRRDGCPPCPGPPRSGRSALRRRPCARLSKHRKIAKTMCPG